MSLFQARSNKALQGKHSVTRAFGTAFASERSAHARKGARHRGASVAPGGRRPLADQGSHLTAESQRERAGTSRRGLRELDTLPNTAANVI